MFAFAGYTGVRRGEMLRSERDDWDFDAGVVSIRQKKADNTKTFTRRSIPIHAVLSGIMREWFQATPCCQWAISTGIGNPIGPRMSTKYFRATVARGKWAVLHGWHVFRHSLASNMAVAGVDQRDINSILGHHTEEMERRYRRLCPRQQEHALNAMFRAQV